MAVLVHLCFIVHSFTPYPFSPVFSVLHGTIQLCISERVMSLAQPRKRVSSGHEFTPVFAVGMTGDSTVIRSITPAALTARASPRTLSLASPKPDHPLHFKPREVETHIPVAALKAVTPPAVLSLSMVGFIHRYWQARHYVSRIWDVFYDQSWS